MRKRDMRSILPRALPCQCADVEARASVDASAAGFSTLTLSCDHRILYGVRAAMFLGAIRSRLERGTT